MKILISSNPPFARSGYGVQTAMLAPLLAEAGHEVLIACEAGMLFGTEVWNGIPLLPAFGSDSVEKRTGASMHGRRTGADIVVTLNDVWPYDVDAMKRVRWVPFCPVDQEPLPYHFQHVMSHAWDVLVYSKWGTHIAQEGGISATHIPLMFDPADYHPGSMADARESLGLDTETFIAVMVADNCTIPSRKSFPQVFEAWRDLRDWRRRQGLADPVLIVHSMPNQSRGGYNLEHLAIQFGIETCITLADSYIMTVGGYEPEYVAQLYRAADVLLSPSMYEGFGVPIVEAQACGCPVIVGGWTSMPELVSSGTIIDPSTAIPYATPFVAWVRYPSPQSIFTELCRTRWTTVDRTEEMRVRTCRSVSQYAARAVFDRYWRPWLDKTAMRIAAETGGNP